MIPGRIGLSSPARSSDTWAPLKSPRRAWAAATWNHASPSSSSTHTSRRHARSASAARPNDSATRAVVRSTSTCVESISHARSSGASASLPRPELKRAAPWSHSARQSFGSRANARSANSSERPGSLSCALSWLMRTSRSTERGSSASAR
jgi:hypothetical protein